MASINDSDAAFLWSDTLDLLEARETPQSTLEMMRSCEPLDYADGILRVGTTARFVQRTLENSRGLIEGALEKAAFQPVILSVELVQQERPQPIQTDNVISQDDFLRMAGSPVQEDPIKDEEPFFSSTERRMSNPLLADMTESDSKLTFERFVQGNENAMALAAAKQVANGVNKTYNPLFIYGTSGLGKTHLLKAIQNYIIANDPSRLCVYRVSRDFSSDYIAAMVNTERSVKEEFERNYRDIDVLIIDDIQYLKPTGQTIEFFFDIFNYLRDHGKQIVLAADRSPVELGMGEQGFDERITSRIDSGFSCPISAPEYELKYALIEAFYERMKEDGRKENIPGFTGTLSDEDLQLMAEKAGSNIRLIEAFCQSCLITASRVERDKDRHITREEIISNANQRWPMGQRVVTVEQIQKLIEKSFDISHADLIGSKRTKEVMIPRHVGIWLTRELTDSTLAEIGDKFGGRSHATVKHSIGWVDEMDKKDRSLHDRISRLRDQLRNG